MYTLIYSANVLVAEYTLFMPIITVSNFVLFHLANVLFILLWFTASDYQFRIIFFSFCLVVSIRRLNLQHAIFPFFPIYLLLSFSSSFFFYWKMFSVVLIYSSLLLLWLLKLNYFEKDECTYLGFATTCALKLWVWIPFMTRCTRYNIIW